MKGYQTDPDGKVRLPDDLTAPIKRYNPDLALELVQELMGDIADGVARGGIRYLEVQYRLGTIRELLTRRDG
jgi:hypothetical protein